MLSKRIIRKNRIFDICKNSGTIKPGELFDRVELIESRNSSVIEQTKVVCCGSIGDEEMLFRSVDGRYYFSITDGWGREGSNLYGIKEGFFVDFTRPTTQDTIAKECKTRIDSLDYNSCAGALAYNAKKSALLKIVYVTDKNKCEGQ
jgi:hypothetical protein